MSKSAIRLLIMASYATALVLVPMVTPAKAAPNGSEETEKNKKKIQKSPGISDSRSSSPSWPPPASDDPDRKPGAGGM
jgi:hypothetical protein